MLVWINNNFENIPTIFSWLTIGMGLVTICLIPILEEYFWSRVIFLVVFILCKIKRFHLEEKILMELMSSENKR